MTHAALAGAPTLLFAARVDAAPSRTVSGADAALTAAVASPTCARHVTASAVSDTLALESVLPLIARVDPEDAATLRDTPSIATYERLPFYPAGGVLRVDVVLQGPIRFRYVYLPAQRALFPTGSPSLLREANAGAGFRLTPEVGVAYVRFYLEAAGNAGWAGRRLAASAGEVPWLPATTSEPDAREARARLTPRIPTATAAPALNGGVRVTAATIRGQAIEVVTFNIAVDGTVTLGQITTLAESAPVVQVL